MQGYSFVAPSVLFQKNTIFNDLPSATPGTSELVSTTLIYKFCALLYAFVVHIKCNWHACKSGHTHACTQDACYTAYTIIFLL